MTTSQGEVIDHIIEGPEGGQGQNESPFQWVWASFKALGPLSWHAEGVPGALGILRSVGLNPA